MSPLREQLVGIIDVLPDQELSLLLEVARRFIPDDVATPDDLEAIRVAQEEYANGEAVPMAAINWD